MSDMMKVCPNCGGRGWVHVLGRADLCPVCRGTQYLVATAPEEEEEEEVPGVQRKGEHNA